MSSSSLAVRCALLIIAAALAMPLVTDASHVRGGQGDVPQCDTVAIIPGDCVAGGGLCTQGKEVCEGCLEHGLVRGGICTPTTTAECPGRYCAIGQVDATMTGQTCITNACP